MSFKPLFLLALPFNNNNNNQKARAYHSRPFFTSPSLLDDGK